jgi:glycosyltransferase involved in cell wall biosynthesis
MEQRNGGRRLVHITTVPITLRFLTGHVAFLHDHGYDVHVVSSPGEDLDRFRNDTGVEAHAVQMERRISPGRDLRALARLTSVLMRIKPDVVHAHTPKAGLLGMLAATAAGVSARVYHIHGFPFVTQSGWRRAVMIWAERTACRLADQVYSVSQSIAKIAADERICRAERLRVLGNGSIGGVDARARFSPDRYANERVVLRRRLGIPDDARVVGYVGRIVRDKGVEQLVAAWADIREKLVDAYLVLVGDVEEQDPISGETWSTLRDDARVRLIGSVLDTPPYYSIMDVVALPSFREGLPVVPLEAAAMALPVVATRIPGCIDAIMDGETGTLVPVGDVTALSRALLTYLQDPDLARHHGAQGRERMLRDFDPDLIHREMLTEYIRLLVRERDM